MSTSTSDNDNISESSVEGIHHQVEKATVYSQGIREPDVKPAREYGKSATPYTDSTNQGQRTQGMSTRE